MGRCCFQKKYKIGIFGLGKTGLSAYKALKNKTKQLICFDNNKEINNLHYIDKKDFIPITDPEWSNLDKIIISPGVPKTHKIFMIAKNFNIKIISDFDILFEETKKSLFITVTGTNGKSTTTSLIFYITQLANLDYAIGGNIGNPVLDLPFNKKGYILEVSSFQLDLIKKFQSNISILLNITHDHLDRYDNIKEYIESKTSIITNTSSGITVINNDNFFTQELYAKYKNTYKLLPISVLKKQDYGVTIKNNFIYDSLEKKIVKIQLPYNIHLQGKHNNENIAAAYAVSKILGIKQEIILKGIESFTGLSHRMEYIGKKNNKYFYNDSKATNTDSAAKSLDFLDNIFWIAGGIVKETNISNLTPFFKKINKAYFFGKDKHIFAQIADSKIKYTLCNDLYEAFYHANNDANVYNKKCNILLAPAASSLDQFNNFEERGNTFIKLCMKIIDNTN